MEECFWESPHVSRGTNERRIEYLVGLRELVQRDGVKLLLVDDLGSDSYRVAHEYGFRRCPDGGEY